MIKKIITILDLKKIKKVSNTVVNSENEECSLVVSEGFFNRHKGERMNDREFYTSHIYSGKIQFCLINTTKGLMVEKNILKSDKNDNIHIYAVERYKLAV